jgi:4-methyl-5(b-hydroxyethyl)-thiazole monophosphate biosynthesis
MRTVASILFVRLATTSTCTAFTRPIRHLTKHQHSQTSSAFSMTKRVLVPIADDSEEIETTCITDTLVRFGAEVVVASVKPGGDLVCKMSRGVKMVADIPIDEAVGQSWDLVVRSKILLTFIWSEYYPA